MKKYIEIHFLLLFLVFLLRSKLKVKEKIIKIATQKNNTKQQTYKKNTCILSQKKIKANPPPLYSTLNPETSSDSPFSKIKRSTISLSQTRNKSNK